MYISVVVVMMRDRPTHADKIVKFVGKRVFNRNANKFVGGCTPSLWLYY